MHASFLEYLGYRSTWVPAWRSPLRELSEALRLALGQSASLPQSSRSSMRTAVIITMECMTSAGRA